MSSRGRFVGLAVITAGTLLAAACSRDSRVTNARAPAPAASVPVPVVSAAPSASAPMAPAVPTPVAATSPTWPPPWACRASLAANDFEGFAHAHDLAGVERGLRAGRARRTFDEQMKGKPSEDQLGLALPPFASRERVLAWTAHPDPASVTLVAARRWPGNGSEGSERWVVIAAGKDTSCEGRADVRVAVVEVARGDGGIDARLLAKTAGPLLPRANWASLPEELGPTEPEFGGPDTPTADEARCAGWSDRTELTALDFAAYELAPGRRAFGVRTTMNEGYAGGGARFESLGLLLIDGSELVPVLDVPVGVYKMLAGDWNPDRTRQHDTIAADLVLEVKPRAGTLADLALHSTTSRHALVFAWSEEARSYACANGVAR